MNHKLSKYSPKRTEQDKLEFWFNDAGDRRCCTCTQYKPVSEFHNDKSGLAGKAYSCKICANSRARKHHADWRSKDPEYLTKARQYYIKRTHGITTEQYDAIVLSQNNACAICLTTSPKGGWHLDHSHLTGKHRGILCNVCNRGLGYFQDDPTILQAAIGYLERHNDDE